MKSLCCPRTAAIMSLVINSQTLVIFTDKAVPEGWLRTPAAWTPWSSPSVWLQYAELYGRYSHSGPGSRQTGTRLATAGSPCSGQPWSKHKMDMYPQSTIENKLDSVKISNHQAAICNYLTIKKFIIDLIVSTSKICSVLFLHFCFSIFYFFVQQPEIQCFWPWKIYLQAV